MRSRIVILKDLVFYQGNIKIIEKELLQYPWDIENPLIKIVKNDLAFVLKKCFNNEISFEDITNWANAIECREDLDFENEELQEIIFELANPEINGVLTKERLSEIIEELA
jgi:hypothetical protein